MSCDADQNAMKTASAATIATRGSAACVASSAMPAMRKIWQTIIHERLRPNTGNRYRSMSGAQRNLKVQGAWASEKSPMVLMSTPRYASQAGRAIQMRPSGRPDEKDWRVTASPGNAALAGLDAVYPDLRSLYVDLHQNPELSFHEEKTAARLAARLRALGFEVTTGIAGTGVVGLLRNGAGPTVMVRTDLDALPVEEKTGLPYA